MTMNHRIKLLERQIGKDSAGQPVDDWVVRAEVWGDCLFQTGAEVMRANAEASIVRCSIRINARSDVTGAWRARYKGVDYDIKSALPDSKDRRKMFLLCESVT
jgi:SPP1 family predicted phage head-tail adaptor